MIEPAIYNHDMAAWGWTGGRYLVFKFQLKILVGRFDQMTDEQRTWLATAILLGYEKQAA